MKEPEEQSDFSQTRCCQHHHKVSLPSLPSLFTSTLFFLFEENFARSCPDSRKLGLSWSHH